MTLGRSALLPGVALGILVGFGIAALLTPFEDGTGDLSEDALEVIERSYWRDVDPAKLEDSSIEGMVEELRKRYRDRFSHYFDPETYEDFQAATSGHFSGIGLAVTEVKEGLRVAQVYENTPAAEAGIEERDLIVEVEGEPIAGEPAEVSTARIKGPPGTEVQITVRSPGGNERELKVGRADVRVPAVMGEIRRSPSGRKLAYLELANFTEGAHGELRAEVERLVRDGAEGIVLDLRGNGGGLLNEAILTTSVFVEDGVIVSTEGRTQEETSYEAVGDALPKRPMAVLIDGDTASAAEILAAAVEDYGLATLVGSRTFGKGTFQEVIELDAGGALNLTVGEYVTSDGASLAGRGVAPQIRVLDRRRTEEDEALERALAVVGRELG